MEKQSMEGERIQLKDQIKPQELKSLLENWADALGRKEDFQVEVKGEKRCIPYRAFEEGRCNVEVEWKHGENEFEVELKWQGPAEDTFIKQ